MRRIQHELRTGEGSQTSFPLVDGENYVAISTTKDSLVVSDQILTVINGSRPSSDIASINQGHALAPAGEDGNFVAVLCMDVDRQCVAIKDIRHGLDIRDERARNVEIFISRRKKSRDKSAEGTTREGQTGTSNEGPDEEGEETASRKILPHGQSKDVSPSYELPEKLPPRQLRLIDDGDQITLSFVTEHTIKLNYSVKADLDSSSTSCMDNEANILKGDEKTELDKCEANEDGDRGGAELNARQSFDSVSCLPETQDNQQNDGDDDSDENGSDEELLSVGDTPAKDNQVTFEEAHVQKQSDGQPEEEDFDHTQAFQIDPNVLGNKRKPEECDSSTGEESSCSEADAGPIPETIGLQPEAIDENTARNETTDKQPPDSATTCECRTTEQETQAYPATKLGFDEMDQNEAGGEVNNDPIPTFGSKRATSDSDSSTTVDPTRGCDGVGDNGDVQTQHFPVATVVKTEDVETDDEMSESRSDVKLEVDNLVEATGAKQGTGENGMNGEGDDGELKCETQLFDMRTQSPTKEARGAVEKDEENDDTEVATEAPKQNNELKTIDGGNEVPGAADDFAGGKRDEAVVKTKPLVLEHNHSKGDSNDACIADKPETGDIDNDVDEAQPSGGEQGTDVMVQAAGGVPLSPLNDIPRKCEDENEVESAEERSKIGAGTGRSADAPSEKSCDGGDGVAAQSAPSENNGGSISGQDSEQKKSNEVLSRSRDNLEVDRNEEPDEVHSYSNDNNQTEQRLAPTQPTLEKEMDRPDPDLDGESKPDASLATNLQAGSSTGPEVVDEKANSVSHRDLSREDENDKVAKKSSPSAIPPLKKILRSRTDDADGTKQQRQNREVRLARSGALETEAASEAIPLQAQPADSSQGSKKSTAKRKRTREGKADTQESRVPVKHPTTTRRTSGQGNKKSGAKGGIRIMFTGIEPNSKHKKMIKTIGAQLLTSIEDAASATRKRSPATVLTHFSPSQRFLAIAFCRCDRK